MVFGVLVCLGGLCWRWGCIDIDMEDEQNSNFICFVCARFKLACRCTLYTINVIVGHQCMRLVRVTVLIQLGWHVSLTNAQKTHGDLQVSKVPPYHASAALSITL